jgi:4-amino-4-deoxy-L-arabinose transferase-like glycosyltransferase
VVEAHHANDERRFLPEQSVLPGNDGKKIHVRAWRLSVWTMKNQAIFLLLVAFMARAGFVLTLDDRLYWPDEITFNDIARGLLNGAGYQSDLFRANPVLPYFLATVYTLFGYNFFAPRLIQCLIGALTVYIVFATAQLLFSRRVAFLAGLWVALYPSLIYVSGVFYVSCLFTFLIVLSIYSLSLLDKHKSSHSLVFLPLSAFIIGITILCRPIFMVFVPFAIFFVVYCYSGSTVRRITYAIALVVTTSLTILPWTLRNYALYNRVIPVSTGSGSHLWKGNNELAAGNADDRHLEPGEGEIWTTRLDKLEPTRRRILTQQYDEVRRDLEALPELESEKYLERRALTFIGQNPGRFLELFARRLVTLYTPFTAVLAEHKDIISSRKQIAFSVIYYPTLSLGLFGALYALKEWRKYLVLYLPIVSLTLAYGALIAASRFRIEFEPQIIIFASYASITIWDFIHTRWHSLWPNPSRRNSLPFSA